ncbi:MAG: DUF4159 domain-containing protein [Gemmatimonadota bacterium]
MNRRIRTPILLLLAGLLVAAVTLSAQVRYFGPRSRVAPGVMPEQRTGFTFCRLAYTSLRREQGGSGWDTDYPMADENLMIRLSELTLSDITRFEDDRPAHAVVRATDDGLFQCPFLFASDVGTVAFDDVEVDRMREYLMKGGMLWVDDFWGTRALREWTREISRVLPELEIVELSTEHPLFSTFYFVQEIPQIPSIQHWRRTGGGTSERYNDSAVPRIYGIFDSQDRLLVLMSHNTDIADGWEREGEDFDFFHSFSPRGYSVGINVAIWAMTH